jgi:hypothetical protein
MALGLQPAFALTGVTAHVIEVEPTYMPVEISFILDAGSSICAPTGPFYWINTNVENVKAVYAKSPDRGGRVAGCRTPDYMLRDHREGVQTAADALRPRNHCAIAPLRAVVGDHHFLRPPAAILGDEAGGQPRLTQHPRRPDASGVAGDRGDLVRGVAGAARHAFYSRARPDSGAGP